MFLDICERGQEGYYARDFFIVRIGVFSLRKEWIFESSSFKRDFLYL